MTNRVDPGPSNNGPHIAKWGVRLEPRMDGSLVLWPDLPLASYPALVTDSLDHWARVSPDHVFLAERNERGDGWRQISYAEFRSRARALALWLKRRDLGPERPVAILSGNDIEHALLAVAAMYAGIPYAPVSPAYSLVDGSFTKLRHVISLLTPGLIFASDGLKYAGAIDAIASPDATVVVTANPVKSTHLLLRDAGPESPAEGPLARVGPETTASILFTSGTAGVPKGVVTTHRMLTSNQEMLRTVFPFFRSEPLVVCDWLPWHHTFGGSHNLGLVLYNGGSLYIDRGRPVRGAFDETIRNLREIAPTVYFNAPKGFEMLVEQLRVDPRLRERFYSRLRMTFFAAAALSKHIWDALDEIALETAGRKIPMLTGLGATETAPFAICANAENTGAGVIGLPVPGTILKLSPSNGKLEARVKGPNVTPGYWRQPELTRKAFDQEGFYGLGDAVRFRDPARPELGLLFDGRIAEDFKLGTGTWVSVGPLRTRLILHFAPYVRDAVIAGLNRDEPAALLFPDPDHLERLRLNGTERMKFQELLESFAESATGSSNRVTRAMIAEEPPSIEAGELTDKGSINSAAVLRRREALIERMYAEPFDSDVLVCRRKYC